MNVSFDFKSTIITILISFIVGCGVTYFIIHNKYEKIENGLRTELNEYKAKYSTIVEEKEKAIIDKAIAEQKAKTPVKEYIKGETVTQIQYLERTSPDDNHLEVTSTPKVYFQYNGEKQELKAVNKDGMKFIDGKWVITQETNTVLNIDDVVNRTIATTIDKNNREKASLKRKAIQNGFWGTVIGIGVGKYIID